MFVKWNVTKTHVLARIYFFFLSPWWDKSSLHWLILGFLYALFVQWSISPTKINSYPITPPSRIFNPLAFYSAQTILVFAQKCYFCAKRASKIVVPPNIMLLSFSIVGFLLTMTSQIESIRLTQYTSLYKNKLFESRSSQWRLKQNVKLN